MKGIFNSICLISSSILTNYIQNISQKIIHFPIVTEIKMWKRKDSNGANYPDILIFIVSCNIIRDGQCSIFVMRSGEDNVTPFIQESGYGLQLGCKIYICRHAVWHSVPGNSKCRCEYYNMLLSICVKWIKTCMKYPITDTEVTCVSHIIPTISIFIHHNITHMLLFSIIWGQNKHSYTRGNLCYNHFHFWV